MNRFGDYELKCIVTEIWTNIFLERYWQSTDHVRAVKEILKSVLATSHPSWRNTRDRERWC